MVAQVSWTTGKPLASDEREKSWRSSKFQFVACCGAIDSRLKYMQVLSETTDVAAMRNIHMKQTRALSAKLYNMLIMCAKRCAETVGARREVLPYRYSALAGEDVSEALECALVQ